MKEFVGKLKLNDVVDITDPCYDKATWCRINTKCTPGEYFGYVNMSDTDWGKRVTDIAIYKDDIEVSRDDMEFIGTIGVDAGLAGFFNNKPDYVGQDAWMDFLVYSGVFLDKNTGNPDKDYFAVEYGLFSESGYGDGSYGVYANTERTAFQIVFIDEDEEEEDYIDEFEEEEDNE